MSFSLLGWISIHLPPERKGIPGFVPESSGRAGQAGLMLFSP